MTPAPTYLQVYSPYRFGCPSCGRQWDTQGLSRTGMPARVGKSNATGFIRSGASTHVFNCGQRTSAERREVNRRDECRWAKTPPTSCRVWNTPRHPGLVDPAESGAGVAAAERSGEACADGLAQDHLQQPSKSDSSEGGAK